MIEFKRNKETGAIEIWKDGKKTGEMDTMGDEVNKKNEKEARKNAKAGS